MPKINKNILLLIALLVVAFVGYFIFMSGGDAPAPLTTVESGGTGSLGQEIVIELNRLKGLRNINDDIFRNPAFASLQDFTQVVIPQPIGRTNPFAPVGN